MYTLSSVNRHTHTQTPHTQTVWTERYWKHSFRDPSVTVIKKNTSFEVIDIISHNSASYYMTNLLNLLIKELLGDTILYDLLRAWVCLLLWWSIMIWFRGSFAQINDAVGINTCITYRLCVPTASLVWNNVDSQCERKKKQLSTSKL